MKLFRRSLSIAAFLALAATLSFAFQAQPKQEPSKQEQPKQEQPNQATSKPDAVEIYKAKCSMCHGLDGKGFSAIKTPDFTDSKWQASVKDKGIMTIIKLGKKDTVMKGFGDQLKDDEVLALVKYIRTMAPKKKPGNRTPRGSPRG